MQSTRSVERLKSGRGLIPVSRLSDGGMSLNIEGLEILLNRDLKELSTNIDWALTIKSTLLLLPNVADLEGFSRSELRCVVAEHLDALGVCAKEECSMPLVVEQIMELCGRVISSKSTRKKSWADLHVEDKAKLLRVQNGRCDVCGVVLDLSRPNQNDSPELDHIIPYVLGGNGDENLRLLCKQCNQAKTDHINVVNDASVWLNYSLHDERRSGLRKAVRFWVMHRDGARCTNDGCEKTSRDCELEVVQLSPAGLFVYDNLVTKCRSHADEC